MQCLKDKYRTGWTPAIHIVGLEMLLTWNLCYKLFKQLKMLKSYLYNTLIRRGSWQIGQYPTVVLDSLMVSWPWYGHCCPVFSFNSYICKRSSNLKSNWISISNKGIVPLPSCIAEWTCPPCSNWWWSTLPRGSGDLIVVGRGRRSG